MKKDYIYILSQNNIIFYIGKTNNIDKRLSNHKITYGEDIMLEILDETDNWKLDEKYWIEQFRQWGFKLQNRNKGGGGNDIVNNFTKMLISQNQPKIKKSCSEERKNKIGSSQPKKKKSCSLERKEKISKANKGKQFNLGKKYNCTTYKKVLQYDLQDNFIKEWTSVKEILDFLNKKTYNMQIYRCLRGDVKKAYGYKWKYKTKVNE